MSESYVVIEGDWGSTYLMVCPGEFAESKSLPAIAGMLDLWVWSCNEGGGMQICHWDQSELIRGEFEGKVFDTDGFHFYKDIPENIRAFIKKKLVDDLHFAAKEEKENTASPLGG